MQRLLREKSRVVSIARGTVGRRCGTGAALTLIGLCVALTAQAGPLHDAASKRDLDKVEKLLAQGADVNARNRYGATALHIAAQGR